MYDECGTCNREFGSSQAARQHMDAVGHIWACDFCDNSYYFEHHLEEHKEDEGHYGAKYNCEACNEWFRTFAHAKRHMNQENHWTQWSCQDCNKGFENENNLHAVWHSSYSLYEIQS
jgi:hypothetical protein